MPLYGFRVILLTMAHPGLWVKAAHGRALRSRAYTAFMGPHPASYTLHHFCIQGEREKQSHPQNASPWGWRELVPKRPKPQQAGLGGEWSPLAPGMDIHGERLLLGQKKALKAHRSWVGAHSWQQPSPLDKAERNAAPHLDFSFHLALCTCTKAIK